VTEIRIYYEGDKCLRPGFRAFLDEIVDRARTRRCAVKLIATGGTPARDFTIAIKKHVDAWNILLLDSDGPYSDVRTSSLISEGWANTHRDSIFWMVEMMESWFHADKDALQEYYGEGFNREALKANPHVEQISKKDLEDGLKAATRNTKKGEYHKTKHAPGLLESIGPHHVRQAAPNCERLFSTALRKLA